MSSDFDTLLDFGDSSAPPAKKDSGSADPFDPFGPSDTDLKGGGDLLDLGFDTQVSATQNGTDSSLDFQVSSNNTNPLYDFTSPDPKMSSSDASNPLYELSNESETTPQKSANPLYDLYDTETTNGGGSELTNGDNVDLLGTNVSEDSGVTMDTADQYNSVHSQEVVEEEEGEIIQDEEEGEIIQEEEEVEEEEQAGKNIADQVVPELQPEDPVELESQPQEDVVLESQPEGPEIVVDQSNEVDAAVNAEAEIGVDEVQALEPEVEERQLKEEVEMEAEPQQEVEQAPQIQAEDIEQVECPPGEIVEKVDQQPMEGEVDQQPEPEIEAVEVREDSPQPCITPEVIEPEQKEEDLVQHHKIEPDFISESDLVENELLEDESIVDRPRDEPKEEAEPEMVEVDQREPEAVTQPEVMQEERKEEIQEEPKVPESPKKTEKVTVAKEPPAETDMKETRTSEVQENGYDEEPERDPNVFRETQDKEEIQHFSEMSSVRQRFESGKSDSDDTPHRRSIKEEYDIEQGGEYESTPVENPDVVKETDRNIGEELPEVGTTKNILEKFKTIQTTSTEPVTSKRVSPPKTAGPVEYVSEPRSSIEKYEGKLEAGVFESQPSLPEGDIVRAGDVVQEEVLPEKGTAKNIAERFKQIESKQYESSPHREKRELTPDKSGKVEYVSEPRSVMETYEGKSESGVFESQPQEEEEVVKAGDQIEDIVPEKGTALSILSKFKQLEAEAGNKPPPSPKRELTPDRSGKVEYVSEPRSTFEHYESKSEHGVFESKPEIPPEVIRAEDMQEDILPEAGAAKNIAERFREIQRSSASPQSPPKRVKEFTPPREGSPGKTVSGALESTPADREGVIKSMDVRDESYVKEEELPQAGMAKNLVNRFKQVGSQDTTSPRSKKEFTPPPESGVYENVPEQSLIVEQRVAESGVLESKPNERPADIARENENREEELPETGFAKNLVSKWKQMESSSGKTSPSSQKLKEFTPPRERGPLSPLSPKSPAEGQGSSVHPSQLPGQYQERKSGGVYENRPIENVGVVKESGTDWTEGLPQANTTKNLLDKFKSIQQSAKESEETPQPVSRKESDAVCDKDIDEEARGSFFAVETEKCAACQKTVYAMEKVEVNKNAYHRTCFKCSKCSARLTAKTFSLNEGIIYCTNHFKQLFARKGNYDEGFGRPQYKKKWGGDKPHVNGNNEEPESGHDA